MHIPTKKLLTQIYSGLQRWKRKSDKQFSLLVAFCRNEATRTPDPYVPNVVRYQLRYIPIAFEKWCHQESNLLLRFILIP